MPSVSKNDLIPNIHAIFVQIIGTQYLHIRIFFIHSSFCNFAHIIRLFDMNNTLVLGPSSRYWSLLPHTSSAYPCSNYHYALFCLVTQSACSIQSARPVNPFDCWLGSPNDRLCLQLNGVSFPHLSPGSGYIAVHVDRVELDP